MRSKWLGERQVREGEGGGKCGVRLGLGAQIERTSGGAEEETLQRPCMLHQTTREWEGRPSGRMIRDERGRSGSRQAAELLATLQNSS